MRAPRPRHPRSGEANTPPHPARISPALQVRQQQQPPEIRAIAWRAQLRLNHRYRRLQARGFQRNKICVALARELAAFVWDIGRHVTPSP